MFHFACRGAAALALFVGLGTAAPAQNQPTATSNWFTGTWSDDAGCATRVHFLGDGRYFTPAGNEGRWRLEGDSLILVSLDGEREQRLRLERLDQNRVRTSGVTSYRCEGRS